MSRTDYLRFAVIGIFAVIALSITHNYWGNPYSRVVMKTVSRFIPSQASITYEDSMFLVTVAPSDIESQRQNILVAAKNNPGDARLVSMTKGSDEGVSYTQGFTTKEMSYWLVASVALLLAVPVGSYRKRLAYLLMVVTLGFVGNVVGLYLVINGQSSFVDDPGSVASWNRLVQLVSFGMLLMPSLVWAPFLIGIWRSESELA